MEDPVDRLPFAELLREHRERLGLTQFRLSSRMLSTSSAYIAAVEVGQKRIGRRSIVLRLAHALELDPYQTDAFLYAAGYAPQIDWQQVTRDLLLDLGISADFTRLTEPYVAAIPPDETREGVFHREYPSPQAAARARAAATPQHRRRDSGPRVRAPRS